MACVQTVVSEKWMDRFVFGLVEFSSVSRTSAAQTFGPDVSEEYSPVIFAGGGGAVADAYPLVVVESDTVQVSDLQLVESDAAQVSVLPVAGWKFPAVFLGRSPLIWLVWAMARRVSEWRDFADFDRRTSPVGSYSPGRNPDQT